VSAPSVAELRARLAELTLRDAARIERRLNALERGTPRDRDTAAITAKVATDIARGAEQVALRRASVPAITYPDLPIAANATRSPPRCATIR